MCIRDSYKAASGKESYVFSPQIDSAKTLTSLDFAHRYNDLPYETQKRCVSGYAARSVKRKLHLSACVKVSRI